MWEDYLKIIVNSAIIYIFIVIGIRVLGKKELAQLSVTDLVFVLLISEVVQNAMIGSDSTLLGGILGAATLFFINKLFKTATFKSEKFSKLMEGEPVILIRHGKLNNKQMKKNQISMRDLEEACRENGEGDINTIDLAILEVDGKISILSDDKIKKGSQFDIDEDELN